MAAKVKPGGTENLQVRLDPDHSAPQQARRAIETLGGRLDARTVGDLRAVVSELVAICLSAPEQPIEIRIELQQERVTGEVRHPGASGVISGGGQALRIIGALVEEWKIATDRTIWFKMP